MLGKLANLDKRWIFLMMFIVVSIPIFIIGKTGETFPEVPSKLAEDTFNAIEQLNEVLTKDKKLVIKNSTPLIDQKSKLESIDIVNLFVNLEKNLKEKDDLVLTFDEILQNADTLKTIGALENFINKKKNEKK